MEAKRIDELKSFREETIFSLETFADYGHEPKIRQQEKCLIIKRKI